jgi:flagellar basal-body rod protein FlgG
MPATMKLTGYTDFSEGPSRHTGNPLDVALEGDGFFSVRTPSGVGYTRQGSFSLNPDSVLVTSDGYPVMGDGGEITIEGQSVAIDQEGYITVDGNEVGRLQIVSFADPNKLEKVRGTLFKPSASGPAPQPVENTVVKQGYLENSNVNAIRMMTDMITEMRMVEAYQRMIRSSDSANTKAINELGRIV